jgi:LuxR family maltose regulon positive regulatory protein
MLLRLPAHLTPPPRARIELERERLLTRLDCAFECMIVLLQAPAGYGKSTALAHWWTRRRRERRERIAWVNLELASTDVSTWLQAVADALDLADAHHQQAPGDARPTIETARTDQQLHALAERLRAAEGKAVLVLDECHRVRSPQIWQALRHLLQQANGALHVVLALRGRLPFAGARWSARGLLDEIDAPTLAFTATELHELARRMHTDALALCEQAYVQSAGWPAAARLALDGDRGMRVWQAYVEEQILHDLPPWSRAVLEEAAVLERFDATLLDAVRGRGDAARILSAPELIDGLLVRDARQRLYWRVQPCLAAELRRRAAPQRVRAVHRAAAAHLATQGHALAAARHALGADDQAGAAHLLESVGGWELVIQHGAETARELLALFPAAFVQANVPLRLIRAYLALKAGAVEHASAELDALSEPSANNGERFARDIRLLRALALAHADRVTDAARVREFDTQLQQTRSDDHLGRAVLSCICAVGALAQGRFGAARVRAIEGMHAMLTAGSAFGAMYALVHAGQAACHSGDLRGAENLFRECLAQVPDHQDDRDAASALGRCLLAQPYYWRDQIEDAADAVLPVLPLLADMDGWFDIYASAYHSAMLVLTARGDADATWAMLDRAASMARRRNLLRLLDLCDAWQLSALVRLRRLDEAQAFAAQFGLERRWRDSVGETSAWRFSLELGTSLAILAIETGHATAAARIAQETATLARTLDAHLAFVQCQLLRATALHMSQGGPEARVALSDAIEYAYAQRAPRVLSDCGLQAQGLLYRVMAGADTAQLSPTQRLWLSEHFVRPVRANEIASPALSQREDAVLREVCLGYSNKVIGNMLGMTENTVKFHLKCAYRKLGVRTRAAAVAILSVAQPSVSLGID